MTFKQRWILHFVHAHAPNAFPNAMIKTGDISKNSVLTGLRKLTARGYLRRSPERLTIARQQGRPQRHYYTLTRKGLIALHQPHRGSRSSTPDKNGRP